MAAKKTRKPSSEELELEEAFRQVTMASKPSASQRKAPAKCKTAKTGGGSDGQKKPVFVACCAVLLAVLAACSIFAYFLFTGNDGSLIRADVYIGGIQLGGKTRGEAAAMLNQELVPQYVQDMVIILPDGERRISPEEAGVSVDVAAIVEDAYAYEQQDVRCELNPLDYLSLDTAAIRSALGEIDAEYHVPLVEHTANVTGERPSLQSMEEAPQILVLTKGQQGISLDTQALYDHILEGYRQGCFRMEPEVTYAEPEAINLQAIYDAYCVAPTDASYALVDGECVVQGGSYGYQFDLEAAQAQFDSAAAGDIIDIPMTYTESEHSARKLKELLFRDTLATCDTYQSSSENRSINLALASEAMNGTIVMPGEVFSYNEVLGRRTTAKGYKPATAYSGGKIVQAVGGGICQGASALYYCSLIADFEIIERRNHTYDASYVPLGMDAAISWGYQDYKFRNNTAYPIRIDSYAYDGGICVSVMGTETKDYYVEMEYEIISKQAPKTEYQVMDYNNPDGYQGGQVLFEGHYAYQIKTYKCKYSNATNELISRTYEASSTYQSYPKTVVQIDPSTIPGATLPPEATALPETTVPEPTLPEATDPQVNP